MYVRGRPLTMNDPSGHRGVGQVAFDPYNGGGMGGWGPVAGMAGSAAGGYAALQLGANAADSVSANVVVPPPFRESVTLTSPTIEIAPFPTAGDEGGVPGDAPTIGLSAVYQQTVGFGNTVLADPLPTVEMGSNILPLVTPGGRTVDPSHIDRIFGERGFTEPELDDIIDNFDDFFLQSDGAGVHLRNNGNGKYDVVITGTNDGNFIVTAFRELTEQSLQAKVKERHWSQ